MTGTTDQVDVNVNVAEKSTGSIQLGAGFSSTEGLVLSGSVSQANVFGTGNRVTAQINTGDVNTVYALSFLNPYFTLDGISLGYDLYKRDVNTDSIDVGDYESSTLGAGVRFGFPVNERDFISLGLVYEQTSITTSPTSPQQYIDYVNTFGSDNDVVRVDASWARDTRNSFLFPTKGTLQRVSSEVGTPLGSLQYYKVSFQHQQFFPLSEHFTLMINGEIGLGGRSGWQSRCRSSRIFMRAAAARCADSKPAPSVRKTSQGDALGGEQRVTGNLELFFPLPGIKDDQSLRMSAFIDAGGAFGPGGSPISIYGPQSTFSDFSFDDLGVSAGVAVLWVSPLGPLKFSLAQPLVSQPWRQGRSVSIYLGQFVLRFGFTGV